MSEEAKKKKTGMAAADPDDPPSDWEEIYSGDVSDFSDWSLIGSTPASSDQDSPHITDQEEENTDPHPDTDTDTDGKDSNSDTKDTIFVDSIVKSLFSREKENKLDDFIEQNILSELPAKALLRFKSTSHWWYHTISNPFFVHTHSTVNRSLSGFFYHSSTGKPCFASFGRDAHSLPDPSLSFLPEEVRIRSSNHGLLCCVGKETLGYYVCNPVTRSWTLLPSQADGGAPPADAAVAIVIKEPVVYNFDFDYYVVCASEAVEGIYGFEVFSSDDWEWQRSNQIAAAETVIAGSGVSAGGSAYWRTTMGMVVGYDPETDALTEVVPPRCSLYADWEIGEMNRRLCCVIVNDTMVEVMALRREGSGPKWEDAGKLELHTDATPLRTQGSREVALWNCQELKAVAVDMTYFRERDLVDSVPGYCADFLPYVSTLIHIKKSAETEEQTLPADRKLKRKEIL